MDESIKRDWRFQEWRLRTRHSQRDVARFLGISTAAVNRHDAGMRQPRPETVRAYAMLYKIPTYALFARAAPDTGDLIRKEYALPTRIDTYRGRLNYGDIGKLADMPENLVEAAAQGLAGLLHEEIIRLAEIFKIPSYALFVAPLEIDEGQEQGREDWDIAEIEDDVPAFEGGFTGHALAHAGQ